MNKPEKIKIRPVGILKANRAKKAHIHKVIIEECGGRDIPYVINVRSVLLYDPGLTVEELVASINVLKDSIALRRRAAKETVTAPMEIKEEHSSPMNLEETWIAKRCS